MSRPPEDSQLVRICLLIIATAAAGVILSVLKSAFVPLVLAGVVTFVVVPLVDWLQTRARVHRTIAVLITFGLVVAAFVVLGMVIASSVSGVDGIAAQYRDRLVGLSVELTAWVEDNGIPVDLHELTTELRRLPVLSYAQKMVGQAISLVGVLVLILIFTLFLIGSRSPETRLTGTWAQIERVVRTYTVTKLATSAVTALLTWFIMTLFGLEMAGFFALMTFILNFIPTVGSIIAVLLPTPSALLQFEPGTALLMLLLLTAVQQTIGNYIEPKIMGRGLDLHPVSILFALLAWGVIWGPIGMLLAAPLTAVIRAVLDRFETTKPIADLLSGRLTESSRQPDAV